MLFGLLLAVLKFSRKTFVIWDSGSLFFILIKETSFSLQFVCAWANKTHHFEYNITITHENDDGGYCTEAIFPLGRTLSFGGGEGGKRRFLFAFQEENNNDNNSSFCVVA